MKIGFKKNPRKEFLIHEMEQLELYMKKLGAGEEYDACFKQWVAYREELEKMSWTNKLNKALPWVSVIVTAVGTIAVPVALGQLAYRKSEEQGELKNGDVWREAISNTIHPSTPKIDSER